MAALLTIPASIAGVLYFLGIFTTLTFAWIAPFAPYLYSCVGFAVLMWLTLFVMDYLTIRHSVLRGQQKSAELPDVPDPRALIETEREDRDQAIEAVYKVLHANVARINQSLNDLAPKPIPELSLKQRTMQLTNELFALLNKQGPQPPEPLSLSPSERNTEAKQTQAMKAYFDWQCSIYYQYMAFFRDRVIKADYELAAAGILTKLNRPDLDPFTKEVMENRHVDVKKIAEALLLTANQMPD
jgi:hypothetical protein